MDPFNIMLWAIILGATSAGMTVALRALPTIYRWVEQAKKPWACDRCMSFWTTGLLSVGLATWLGHELIIVCGPAYPWAMFVLCKITDPRGPPPLPLEDSDAPTD